MAINTASNSFISTTLASGFAYGQFALVSCHLQSISAPTRELGPFRGPAASAKGLSTIFEMIHAAVECRGLAGKSARPTRR